jgi:hypothetical protein
MTNIHKTETIKKTKPDTLLTKADIADLDKAEKKLLLAAEEQQRLEDEGGIPLTKEQEAKVETHLKAIKSIHKVIADS